MSWLRCFMNLCDVRPAKGSVRNRKRKARGHGCGTGKTAGRGSNGQASRSGGTKGKQFEGGQTPWYRRIPHLRGESNRSRPTGIFRTEYEVVNLKRLNEFEENSVVTPENLFEARLVSKKSLGIKVLGQGELTRPLTIKAHKFSKTALEKIQAIGGKAEVIEC